MNTLTGSPAHVNSSHLQFDLGDNRQMNRLFQAPAPTAEFIRPLTDVGRDKRVVLCARVSTYKKQNSHLIGQLAGMWERMPVGTRLVGVHGWIGSGCDPIWIAGGSHKAAERRADFLVVESPNRAVRHPNYNSQTNPNVQALGIHLFELKQWCHDVPIVSVCNPSADAGQERAHETARGMRYKNRRRELQPVVRALFRSGYSTRWIETEMKGLLGWIPGYRPISQPTISNWCKGEFVWADAFIARDHGWRKGSG